MQWIFFDLGGVLIDFRYEEWCAAIAALYKRHPMEIDRFWTEPDANGRSLYHRSDLGLLDEIGIWTEFSEAFGELAFFSFQFSFMHGHNGIIDPTCRLVRELIQSERIYLGLISNINAPHLSFVRGVYADVLNFFPPSLRFFSCSMELRKEPGTRLFKQVFSLADAEPSQSWLVDDCEENVEAFRANAGNGIHYDGDPEKLRRTFKTHGLL